jgi:hypothetical protein
VFGEGKCYPEKCNKKLLHWWYVAQDKKIFYFIDITDKTKANGNQK